VSASVLYMSMSLDGYIAGPNDEPDNPGGDGFGRLHEWIQDGETFRSSGPTGQLIDEINAAGALLAGRRTVEQVDHGIAAAMAQAKAAAGDRDVLVHGAYTAQRTLEAGVLDELQVHQIPVLFGQGLRLFDVLPSHPPR